MLIKHNIISKINKSLPKDKRFKLRRYLLSILDNDILVYDDIENRIVYRNNSIDTVKTIKYVNSQFKKSSIVEIPREKLLLFIQIPNFNSAFKDSIPKQIKDIISQTKHIITFLDIKIKIIKLCDKYNERDTQGNKLQPTFNKVNEELLIASIGNKEAGGINEIYCSLAKGVCEYIHKYNGKKILTTFHLEKIFE